MALAEGLHHYVVYGMDRERISEPAFLDAKGIEGAQLKYSWKQLEQGKDNYVFDDIHLDLAFLNAKGKELFIQVQDSFFSLNIVPIPKYLLNDPQYHGGADKQYDVEGDDVETRSRTAGLRGGGYFPERQFEAKGLYAGGVSGRCRLDLHRLLINTPQIFRGRAALVPGHKVRVLHRDRFWECLLQHRHSLR